MVESKDALIATAQAIWHAIARKAEVVAVLVVVAKIATTSN
jgi:hypothetical protein